MANEYNQSGPSRYPFEFVNQFATINRTKRYIDDIFTVSLRHTLGLSLKGVISQEDILYGMCLTTVRDVDGNVRPSLISIFRYQQGPSIHFLDIEVYNCPRESVTLKCMINVIVCLP